MSSSLTGQTFQVNNTTLTIQERIYHVPTQELWESKIMSVKGWQRRRSVYNCQKPGSDEKFVLKVDKFICNDFKPESALYAWVERFFDNGRTRETNSLRDLTTSGCFATPKLIDNATTKAANGEMTSYIIMEKLPGVVLGESPSKHPDDLQQDYMKREAYWTEMDDGEREQVRKAFKESWLECMRCGYKNTDAGRYNLIWDKATGKCYIIDWEAESSGSSEQWDDLLFQYWKLL